MELTKFVPLDKMKQLRVAYMASKRDPSLITIINEDVLAHSTAAEVTANNQRPKESQLLSFQMMPKTLLNPAIQKDPPDQQAQEKLFQHIIQYHNQRVQKDQRLFLQSYIDCEISGDQHNVVLKIITSDIPIGAIIGLSGGDADRKQLACHKLSLVDVDINAWSCLMNTTERLILTKERLQLVAELARLQSGKVAEN